MFQPCLCNSSFSSAIRWVLSSCPVSRKNEVHRKVEGEQDEEEIYLRENSSEETHSG